MDVLKKDITEIGVESEDAEKDLNRGGKFKRIDGLQKSGKYSHRKEMVIYIPVEGSAW